MTDPFNILAAEYRPMVLAYPPPGASIRTKIPFTPAFRADRSFIYLIRDRESGAVLFLGRMLNPSGLAD